MLMLMWKINSIDYLVGGWYAYPSEKMMEFVSWDDDIPNINGNNMFQTTNQV